MLSLKQALSLTTIRPQGKWSPDDESSLVAWYQNQVGITLNGSDVAAWADSSANDFDMVQAGATEQPAYSGGVLTFSSDAPDWLQSVEQISLTGDFTVGLKINPAIAIAGTFLADNTTSGELFKYQTASRITVKIDGSSSTSLDLDIGSFGDDYLVITRLSNVLTLYHNGVKQTDTEPTLAATADIDAIGIRNSSIDPFDGDIEEIQIYSSSSTGLTADINARLSTL